MLSCQSHLLPRDEISPNPDMDQVEASCHPVSISMTNVRLIAERFKDKLFIMTHTRCQFGEEGRPHQLMDPNVGPPTQHPPQLLPLAEFPRVGR